MVFLISNHNSVVDTYPLEISLGLNSGYNGLVAQYWYLKIHNVQITLNHPGISKYQWFKPHNKSLASPPAAVSIRHPSTLFSLSYSQASRLFHHMLNIWTFPFPVFTGNQRYWKSIKKAGTSDLDTSSNSLARYSPRPASLLRMEVGGYLSMYHWQWRRICSRSGLNMYQLNYSSNLNGRMYSSILFVRNQDHLIINKNRFSRK